jgi:hypothetical protein
LPMHRPQQRPKRRPQSAQHSPLYRPHQWALQNADLAARHSVAMAALLSAAQAAEQSPVLAQNRTRCNGRRGESAGLDIVMYAALDEKQSSPLWPLCRSPVWSQYREQHSPLSSALHSPLCTPYLWALYKAPLWPLLRAQHWTVYTLRCTGRKIKRAVLSSEQTAPY